MTTRVVLILAHAGVTQPRVWERWESTGEVRVVVHCPPTIRCGFCSSRRLPIDFKQTRWGEVFIQTKNSLGLLFDFHHRAHGYGVTVGNLTCSCGAPYLNQRAQCGEQTRQIECPRPIRAPHFRNRYILGIHRDIGAICRVECERNRAAYRHIYKVDAHQTATVLY